MSQLFVAATDMQFYETHVPEALCAGAACESTERISLCVICTTVLH